MNKISKIRITNILFFLIVVIHIYGLVYSETIAFMSKPFLMTTLCLIYIVNINKPSFWILSALFFSFWGDVLLLFDNRFFVFGLGSFLIAHLCYIKEVFKYVNKIKLKSLLIICIPFIIYLFFLFSLILENINNIKIPVIIYAIVISVFGVVSSMNYYQNKNFYSFLLLVGALLFIISDSLIAVNKFYNSNESYSLLIMITYILAQFFICKSFLIREKNII